MMKRARSSLTLIVNPLQPAPQPGRPLPHGCFPCYVPSQEDPSPTTPSHAADKANAPKRQLNVFIGTLPRFTYLTFSQAMLISVRVDDKEIFRHKHLTFVLRNYTTYSYIFVRRKASLLPTSLPHLTMSNLAMADSLKNLRSGGVTGGVGGEALTSGVLALLCAKLTEN